MSRYIVHVGTGTIIDANDDVFIVDLNDEQNESIGNDESELVAFAEEHGIKASTLFQEITQLLAALDQLNESVERIFPEGCADCAYENGEHSFSCQSNWTDDDSDD